MTTKFKVTIHATGALSTDLLRIIGYHNEGKANVNLEDLCGYVKVRSGMYPVSEPSVISPDADDHTINVSSKEGELPYLTIQECIYEELISNPVLDQYATENLSQAGEQC
jgi:hypothetical protein